jgi:hypothetical protein
MRSVLTAIAAVSLGLLAIALAMAFLALQVA